MVKQENSVEIRHLDEEWVELIKMAKNSGLTKLEVRHLLYNFTYVKWIMFNEKGT
ncbi:anti-repressor SinI family protein [Virgibacillus kimchii]